MKLDFEWLTLHIVLHTHTHANACDMGAFASPPTEIFFSRKKSIFKKKKSAKLPILDAKHRLYYKHRSYTARSSVSETRGIGRKGEESGGIFGGPESGGGGGGSH